MFIHCWKSAAVALQKRRKSPVFTPISFNINLASFLLSTIILLNSFRAFPSTTSLVNASTIASIPSSFNQAHTSCTFHVSGSSLRSADEGETLRVVIRLTEEDELREDEIEERTGERGTGVEVDSVRSMLVREIDDPLVGNGGMGGSVL